mmetsp:Transcript_7642/g.11572  ORF Transcript_7642/g.11572 Transcript_7642/m.11572 type:complete len:174 (-) Transcript_7642:54-575(-)
MGDHLTNQQWATAFAKVRVLVFNESVSGAMALISGKKKRIRKLRSKIAKYGHFAFIYFVTRSAIKYSKLEKYRLLSHLPLILAQGCSNAIVWNKALLLCIHRAFTASSILLKPQHRFSTIYIYTIWRVLVVILKRTFFEKEEEEIELIGRNRIMSHKEKLTSLGLCILAIRVF